ncbi:MAG: AAA family ATPase [Candidatus Nanoarchaeia archaeon]
MIGVISLKGGVGKTTTVSNIGALLSQVFEKKVLVVDANFSAPNLGLHVGIVNPEKTVHDVLNDKVAINSAIRSHALGFDIIPASLNPKKINPFKLKTRLDKVRKMYDIIIIDSSPTLNDEILTTMIASDELLVVTSPDYPTLSCTTQAVKVARKKGTPIIGLIMNKVRNKRYELNVCDIEDATGLPVLSVIPEDAAFSEALAACTPASLYMPNKDFSVEFKKLAGALIGEPFEDTRLLARLRQAFRPDLTRAEVNRLLLSR